MSAFFLGFGDELEKLAVMTPMKKLLLAAAAAGGAAHLYRKKARGGSDEKPRTGRGGGHTPTRVHGLLSGKPKEPKSKSIKQMMAERWHQWKKDEKASAATRKKTLARAARQQRSPLFTEEVATGKYRYKTKAPVPKPKD